MLDVLVRTHVPCCQLSWALNPVMKYGEINGTYIMMLAIHSVCVCVCVCVEYCDCKAGV
jgi:hypothetical protein